MEYRAEIIETGDPRKKSASIIINAPAATIFNLLADPAMHSVIDGSRSVQSVISAPARLSLDARFSMNMKIGVRYRITNRVVEFEEGKVIAWRHLGRWVWRYELREVTPTQTVVIESFDGNPSPLQLWLRFRKAYPYVQIAIAKSLVRLKKYFEDGKS
ncbi:MAG: polyketide cyclase / dehydrase and lipid transport [Candidatus Nanopelagicaceae bacterium]|nr:polyketide cyclase / dehydrase and lipid transport [Candidatus Nanopelagicaceae bacterium]